MNIENYEKACEIIGHDPNNLPDVSMLSEQLGKGVVALVKLKRLEKATNGEWVADFNNRNQLKHTGWLDWSPSRGAFVFTCTFYPYTATLLGTRFWFEDDNTARYFTKQHIDLINDLHLSKI